MRRKMDLEMGKEKNRLEQKEKNEHDVSDKRIWFNKIDH